MIYNIFISHSWDYGDQYSGLIRLLNSNPYFNYRDYSIPKDDPIHHVTSDQMLKVDPCRCICQLQPLDQFRNRSGAENGQKNHRGRVLGCRTHLFCGQASRGCCRPVERRFYYFCNPRPLKRFGGKDNAFNSPKQRPRRGEGPRALAFVHISCPLFLSKNVVIYVLLCVHMNTLNKKRGILSWEKSDYEFWRNISTRV